MFWINIDDFDLLSKQSRFFRYNRFNLFSLYDSDHGKRQSGVTIKTWIQEFLGTQNISYDADTKIYMLVFPRFLGYVFNPISIYFIYKQQKLHSLLYQVKNTFGQQHCYFLPVQEKNELGRIQQKQIKKFHVSPFIHMDCTYHFDLKSPDQFLDFRIHQYQNQDQQKILTADWRGKWCAFSDKNLFYIGIKIPIMTIKIITAIHWEALKLWMKGAKYIPKPPTPPNDIST
jgi:DUF1365 family protein